MADSAGASNTSPGEILKGARELYGWSLEEVATELNLLPHVVEALEADDYSHTAGWTYAVGYLRNYARLAGVSIEQAIADRKELLPPKEDGPGTMTEGSAPNKPQPVPIQYRWVVTAVVLILVIGGLYAAYLNRASDVERVRVDLAEESRSQVGTKEAGESASTDRAGQAASQPALAVSLTPEAQESPAVAVAPEVPASTDDVEVAEDSSAEIAAQTPASPPASAEPEKKKVAASTASTVTTKTSDPKVQDKPKPKSTSESSSGSGSKPASQAGAAKPKQKVKKTKQPDTMASVERRLLNPEFSTALSSMGDSTTSATTRPLTADSRGIILKVQESTHVVVWDRDNVELFRRYVEGGKVVSLSGEPPFTLLVSYPDGAKVVYGGREFSIPVGKSGRNAKVRVGR